MGTLTAIVGSRVYLDTNIIIYAMEDLAAVGAKLRTLFARVDAGEMHAVTSELAIAECLVKPLRDGKSLIVDEYEKFLQTSDSLTVFAVTRSILREAAKLRASSILKLPDAIHAATCLATNCTTFLTNDVRFRSLEHLPVLMVSDLP